jgi:hypothetical protein
MTVGESIFWFNLFVPKAVRYRWRYYTLDVHVYVYTRELLLYSNIMYKRMKERRAGITYHRVGQFKMSF